MSLFDRFYNLLQLRATTPWCQAQTVQDWTDHTRAEAVELNQAAAECYWAETASVQKVAEEAGDVLANILGTIIKLEEETQGKITLDSVMLNAEEKLKRRKPWMMGPRSGWPDTAEEEHAIWLKIKAKEKA